MPPTGTRRRYRSGCGPQHGCTSRARASSAMEQLRCRACQSQVPNVTRRAGARGTRSPMASGVRTMDDVEPWAVPPHGVGKGSQFEGAHMRLGRLARPTRGEGPTTRMPPLLRREFEGPALGLGRRPTARFRRLTRRGCGSRRGTATCRDPSPIMQSEWRSVGPSGECQPTDRAPPNAWRP